MKFLKAFLLAIALALASAAPVPAQIQPRTANIQQDEERAQDLGDGYETKVRNGVRLIKFPADHYLTGEEGSVVRFREGVNIALVKVFTCSAFKDCKPQLKSGLDGDVLFEAGDRTYIMGPLYSTQVGEGVIIGIAISPLPRA